jgi:uncharacterized protein YacL
MIQKHVVLTAIGLVLGILALFWVQPQTSAGASFLLVVIVVILNAVAVFIPWKSKEDRKS